MYLPTWGFFGCVTNLLCYISCHAFGTTLGSWRVHLNQEKINRLSTKWRLFVIAVAVQVSFACFFLLVRIPSAAWLMCAQASRPAKAGLLLVVYRIAQFSPLTVRVLARRRPPPTARSIHSLAVCRCHPSENWLLPAMRVRSARRSIGCKVSYIWLIRAIGRQTETGRTCGRYKPRNVRYVIATCCRIVNNSAKPGCDVRGPIAVETGDVWMTNDRRRLHRTLTMIEFHWCRSRSLAKWRRRRTYVTMQYVESNRSSSVTETSLYVTVVSTRRTSSPATEESGEDCSVTMLWSSWRAMDMEPGHYWITR